MVRWNGLTRKQRIDLAVQAGFELGWAEKMSLLAWAELDPQSRDRIYRLDWYYVLGIQEGSAA